MANEDNIYLSSALPLDDSHVALAADVEKPYPLSVLDLATASLHPTIDRAGDPLLYTALHLYDTALIPDVGVISDLRPLNKEGTSLATVQKVQNGAITEGYWPVTFDW